MRSKSRFGSLAILCLFHTTIVTADTWRNTMNTKSLLLPLVSRADTCPASNPVSCSAVDSKLPSNFCCPSGTACVSLDSSSSAICCPNDGSCPQIKPITCDVSLQNASLSGPILTTKLQDSLPTCAGQCCPFGYSCSGSGSNALCVLNRDTSIYRNSTSSVSSAASSSTSTSATVTSTSNPTATSVNSIDSKNQPQASSNKFPPGVFLAGFFPGIVLGILLTLAWVVLTGRNLKQTRKGGSPGLTSTASFTKAEVDGGYGSGSRPWISHPFPTDRHSNERSDFLSRTRSRARSIFSLHRGNHTRTVDSVDMWNSKMPTPPEHNNVPTDFVSRMSDVPVTPARRVARYSEDEQPLEDRSQHEMIKIYSPELMQSQKENQAESSPAFASGAVAVVPPLRSMQGQRERPISASNHLRHDSDVDANSSSLNEFSGFGSPFQTPDKKNFPAHALTANAGITKLQNKTFHDITTLDSGSPINRNDPGNNSQGLPTLSPARYEPTYQSLHTSAQANAKTTTNQPRSRPPIPNSHLPRPDTEIDDSDGISVHFDNPPPPSTRPLAPSVPVPPVHNPHLLHSHTLHPNSHTVTCGENHDPRDRDPSNKSKHATNATTFTQMLRQAGIPDVGNQIDIPKVPKVPKGYL